MSATARQHDHPDQRKARGAFFTPPALCHHMAAWAIRTAHDRVLEPSCGEAAFLNAAADRLTALGDPAGARLDGVEVHAPSAREARRHLAERGIPGRVRVADMFALTPRAAYDVVIGNPPYVRYQDFTGPARAAARQAALRGGVRLSGLASSWAPFVVHVAHFLAPGGRLALVVPAELLSTNYAAEVRSFLMRRFARVRLVVFRERVFPRVQEEVVLLLAEGDGPTDHCELHQVDDLAGLDEMAARARISRWQPEDPTGKWTAALLDEPALAAYRQLLAHPELGTLHDWGETTLGAVTGANRFFALTQTQVDTLGLGEQDLVAISPPGSRHLRRLEFTGAHWESLRDHDRPVWLFRPTDAPSPAGAALIDAGEASGVPRAYKCRTRTPWWRTPIGPPPDLLITYMNADTPRLTRNLAGVRHLNSVHGLHLHAHIPTPAADLLALAALNSLTLLGAETVGRAYGGGLLKLEPREADRLPAPGAALLARLSEPLRAARPSLERALAHETLPEAVAVVDRVLLIDGLGIDPAVIDRLAQARATLASRRAARARRA